MNLRHKLLSSFLVIVLLFSIAGYISIRTSQSALEQSIGESSSLLAAEVLDILDMEIFYRIEEFQIYTKDLILQEAAKESNREFEKLADLAGFIERMDREWTSAPREELTPFMKGLMYNRLADELREKIAYHEKINGYNIFAEVFVTNKYGVNIAQTGKTEDYRQDDETWWKIAGEEGIYVGDIAYDTSARAYSISCGIRIDDEDGELLGIIKYVLNLRGIKQSIDELSLYGKHEGHVNMQNKLLTSDGKMIYSTETYEPLKDVSYELAPFIQNSKAFHKNYFVSGQPGKKGKLVSHAHSHGYKGHKGLGWIFLIEHNTEEIFAPVTEMKNHLMIIMLVVISITLLVGLLFSSSVARPVSKLNDAANEISRGNFDVHIKAGSKDEIGHLASSFKHMAGQLKKSTEDMNTLNKNMSALYRVSSTISRTIEMDKLFDVILNTITDLDILNVERSGGIFLVKGERMELVAHLGHSRNFLDLHKDMTTDTCLCGLAAKTGEIIISKKCTSDIRHTIHWPGMSHHGHIILPLNAKARVVGVLYLYLPENFTLDIHMNHILLAIANQLGVAIHNAQLHNEIKESSLHDPLTGLANRRLMDIDIERNFARTKRTDAHLSVIMLDIDHFKKYNDTYGHTAGDELLVTVSDVIASETREMDLVVRYGGEEFLVLLPNADLTEAAHVAERIRNAVQRKTDVTISIGVSSYHRGMKSAEELIGEADTLLYAAKQNGRNRVEAGSPDIQSNI